MNTKQKLGYMVVGGALVAIGMAIAVLVVSLVSTVAAQFEEQPEDKKFGEIKCTKLTVVGEDGNPAVMLVGNNMMTNSGAIYVLNKGSGLFSGEPHVEINSNEVVILRHTGFVLARIVGNDHDGGLVQVNRYNRSGSAAGVRIENGKVVVYGDRGILGEERALLAIDEHGGRVFVSGKDGESAAGLGIIEDGGVVATTDKFGDTKILD